MNLLTCENCGRSISYDVRLSMWLHAVGLEEPFDIRSKIAVQKARVCFPIPHTEVAHPKEKE